MNSAVDRRTPAVPADAPQSANDSRSSLVIDVRGVRKDFGSGPVLRDLSLAVHQGEIFGLIGPSGSGKSTTIHLLCGHLRPSGGTVTVFGQQPSQFEIATRRQIGYMAQGFVLFPDLTVRENVAFAAGLYGMSEWTHRALIHDTLRLVELWDARDRPASKVSGGMQRRIALAAALVHSPDLLFADEPTANLDPILRAKLWAHFRELSERGRTLLLTTQYIDEAEYCDRVGLMFDGALIAEGRPAALRKRAFGGDMVDLLADPPTPEHRVALERLEEVTTVTPLADGSLRVVVADADQTIPDLIDAIESTGAAVRSVGQYQPTFDEVFIRLIEQHGEPAPPTGRLRTSAAAEV